jgi:hypothetical protein
MKKSFVLHKDSLFILDELSDEQAGKLFKAIKAFHEGKNYPLEFALHLAFLSFKNQFERDAEKYVQICERNKNNGVNGGRPKKANETQKTQSVILKPKKPDNDSDNESESKNDLFSAFWSAFDKKVDRKKCSDIWAKIPVTKRDQIIEAANKYRISTPEARYRKNPLTWLRGECWNDEPIINLNTQNNEQFNELTKSIREQYPNV